MTYDVKLLTICRHIDYLILNAAVFALPHTTTSDNYETIFQVCHLSHFYLTKLLDNLLNQSSRVVVVSSESHRFSNYPSSDLNESDVSPAASKFWSMMAYNNAKLANVLFAKELSKVSLFCFLYYNFK